MAVGLQSLLGTDSVDVTRASFAAHEVDGQVPVAIARPSSIAALSELLAWADRENVAITPWGGGTKQGVGRPLERLDVVARMDALSNLVEIDRGNLTAEVEAGIRLSDLQRVAAEHGVFCPLDPADGDAATVGGIIATNASGPRRLLHRTARDQVLGLHVVLADGTAIVAGGKVVKDVAGYNLTKPMIGSWGTLGIVTRATLRLLPLPEASKTVMARFEDPREASRVAMTVRSSVLLPSAIELCTARMFLPNIAGGNEAHGGGHWLLFGLESHAEAVERMASQVLSTVTNANATDVMSLNGAEASPYWTTLRSGKERMGSLRPTAVRARASLPMASLGDYISRMLSTAISLDIELEYSAHAGNGVAYLFLLPNAEEGVEQLVAALSRARDLAGAMGGFVTIETGPLEVKRLLDPLPTRDDYRVMRKLRETMNPRNTLNPGKLV